MTQKNTKNLTVRQVVQKMILNKPTHRDEIVKNVISTYKKQNVTKFKNGRDVTDEKLKSESLAVVFWFKKGYYKKLALTHKFEEDEKTQKVKLIPKSV